MLPNPDGHWRPGLFVTGNVVIENLEVPVRVPTTALQTLDGQTVVFVKTAAGFAPQPVTLGRSNDAYVEVTGGLEPGQPYVTLLVLPALYKWFAIIPEGVESGVERREAPGAAPGNVNTVMSDQR